MAGSSPRRKSRHEGERGLRERGKLIGRWASPVESLVKEAGLTLVCGEQSAQAHVRWVHSTELTDPTPWLKGGELLLTMGIQLDGPKAQRELIDRLAGHEIAGLGFGTGFTHRKLPAALVTAARKRDFPLFEVPYELPFIAITERAFAQLVGRALRNAAAEHGRRRARGGAHRPSLPRGAAGPAAPVRYRRADRRARLRPPDPTAAAPSWNGSSTTRASTASWHCAGAPVRGDRADTDAGGERE